MGGSKRGRRRDPLLEEDEHQHQHSSTVVSSEAMLQAPKMSTSPQKALRLADDVVTGRDSRDGHEDPLLATTTTQSSTVEHKTSAGDLLDFRERGNTRFEESAISRTVDQAFFSSMKINLKGRSSSWVSNAPLHQAIFSGDEIDVQMLLAELGSGVLNAISARDSAGRTAVHIAAVSGSARIVTILLETYRAYEGQQLEYELIRLGEEYRQTIDELRKKMTEHQGTSENKSMKRDFDAKMAAVKEWFEKERTRKMRVLEFRIEVSRQCVSTAMPPNLFYPPF